MATRKVTKEQAERALAEVARQLGGVPTGEAAARSGDGPELNMEWDWPGQPTPTILLESSLYEEWALTVDGDAIAKAAGVFAEPYSGYALCLYPIEPTFALADDARYPCREHGHFDCAIREGGSCEAEAAAEAMAAEADRELTSGDEAEVQEIVDWFAAEATANGNEVTPELREAFVYSARAVVTNGNGALLALIRREHDARRRGYHTLVIEQLDERGNVYRTFTHHPAIADLERALDDARRAYNMASTRLVVDGATVQEPAR